MDRLGALKEQLKSVPQEHGVYLWKDSSGKVLYVGKAKRLKSRMSQYLNGSDERAQIPLMLALVHSFDYLVTSSETESLILEVNLINQFSPPFNVDYRDDKSFPFIALTLGDDYPAIKYTREKHRPGTKYFGPYTDARGARATIEAVRKIVPLCRASCAEWRRLKSAGWKPLKRPCFDSHIGLGPGACIGALSKEDYAVSVARVVNFLSGKHEELEDELIAAMHEASDDLDFESAARYRNRLRAIESIKERQKMVADSSLNLDIIGFYREETIAGAYVLVVREGRVLYGNEFTLDKGMNVAIDDLVSGFLTKYYLNASEISHEIVLRDIPADSEALSAWLEKRREELGLKTRKVRLIKPQRGLKSELLDMAEKNARHSLMRFMARSHYSDTRINEAMLQLESALALNTAPHRIESIDISTLHGTHSVGSLIVFSAGKKDPKSYRRFKIRMESDEANDVAMMREVLSRRFSTQRREDTRFASMPNLLIVDGGKPQLNATLAALEELGIDNLAVAGLAKRDEELFVPWSDEPVVLPDGSASLYLVKQIRDEAHRFAIEYHRLLRSKAMTASILEEVIGMGEKRRKALLKHFGSFKKLKAASREEIAQVKGITAELAGDVYDILHRANEEDEG